MKEDLRKQDVTCRVCGEGYETEPAVYCRDCETPHHKSCFDYNEKCSIFGCGSLNYKLDISNEINSIDIKSEEKVQGKQPNNSFRNRILAGMLAVSMLYVSAAYYIHKDYEQKMKEITHKYQEANSSKKNHFIILRETNESHNTYYYDVDDDAKEIVRKIKNNRFDW